MGTGNKVLEQLKELIKTKSVYVSIDLYIDNPFMLLGRIKAKKAYVIFERERMQIKTADSWETMLLNVKLDVMKDIVLEQRTTDIIEVRFCLKDLQIQYRIMIEV